MKTLFAALLGSLTVGLFALAFAGGQLGPNAASDLTAALSNIKQIGTGTMIYMADYDDKLPFARSTSEVKKLLHPYLKNDSLWSHPRRGDILYNTALAGFDCTKAQSPSKTLMFWERKSTDGRRAVSYLDSSAKALADAEWTAAWKAELKRRKTER